MIVPEIAHLDLDRFMREEAEAAGEYPIGAVLVIGGEIVSRGREHRSPLRHAELNPLLGGEKLWKNFDQGVLEAEARRLMVHYHPKLLRYEETGWRRFAATAGWLE